jgi:3-deoxy-D-manno-octulosonic-acid transferase
MTLPLRPSCLFHVADLRTGDDFAVTLILPTPKRSLAVLYRWIYSLGMYLMTPVILYRLAWRGLRYREYLDRWPERFGYFPAPGIRDAIWVHAVSMGEVNAAAPLIEALMRRFAGQPMVVTTVTPTGSARVQKLFGGRVFHVYLPYDLNGPVRRFLDRVQPALAVIMETEIWPNLFLTCRARGIPIVVANARLSDRSLRGYRPVWPLARQAVRAASFLAAQSPQDAERLLRLGAQPERLVVAGNIKYDMAVPPGLAQSGAVLREYFGRGRPVWIAASTHEGEELPVLEAQLAVLKRFPDALLVLVPRHPERFRPAAQLARQLGLNTRTRSDDNLAEFDTQCFVVDTLGELLLFYAASDVAFVAGSFDSIGGHNVLEPAALGKPVLVGPNTFNFQEITDSLLAAGAAERVADARALGSAVVRLLCDEPRRAEMGRAALEAVQRERGAVDRNLEIIERAAAGAA